MKDLLNRHYKLSHLKHIFLSYLVHLPIYFHQYPKSKYYCFLELYPRRQYRSYSFPDLLIPASADLHKQLDVLMHTDISERFSFLEVYEAIVFTCIRGISTEKGARELDEFIDRYRAALMKEEEDRA